MATPQTATGKAYVRRPGDRDLGDGDQCPAEGHGRKYKLGAIQWCPDQSHDRGKDPVPRA